MTEKTTKPDPLESLAQQADNLPPPLGEGVTEADVSERQAQELAPVEQGNAELLAGMFQLARDTVTQLADVHSIQRTLPNEATVMLGNMWGNVLDGYGIKLSAYMGKHGALIMATVATLALGKNVLKGYREEMAAKKPTGEPAPAPEPLPEVPAQ